MGAVFDMAKMAVRIAIVAAIIAAVVVLFTRVQIPASVAPAVGQALGAGWAFFRHWFVGLVPLLVIAVGYFALEVTILTVRGAVWAFNWVMKIQQG